MKKIFMLGVLVFLFSFKHPFYLGVVDLKYNAKEKALQGSVKLFTNDLEGALKKINKQTIDLINPKDKEKTKKRLEDYLKKHLGLKVNNAQVSYECLGFEHQDEAIWIYIELPDCASPKKIEIENSLLYDYISGQSNIVHIEVNSERKSFKVNNPDRLMVFEF